MKIPLSSPLLMGCAGIVAILAGCTSTPDQASPQPPSPSPSTAVATSDTAFTASGNEPFWSVAVDGTSLTYSTPEIQPGKQFTAERSTVDSRVVFNGMDGSTPFTLDITPSPCSDSMSGRDFQYSAKFVYGDRTMTGCAREGADRPN